jgi:predicted type IV restriction endonuclease
MDFKDQIKVLTERVNKLKDQVATEEATKTALILPFLQTLGYDVFDPAEIVPEYIADIGIKKGEKVDYAIFRDGKPVILIECKHWTKNLDPHDSQLFRYFHTSKAKFGLLTNGIRYKFYTDLVEANKMDEKPFFEFDLSDMRDPAVEELKKFHKSYFDLANIVNSAAEMKYTNELKAIIVNELRQPSADFVKFLTNQVYTGRITDKVMLQFNDLVKRSCQQVISDMITERLKNALDQENGANVQPVTTAPEAAQAAEPRIDTTDEEKEAFFILKSILRNQIDSARIGYKDLQTYFAVIIDEKASKTICRLYLGGSKKQIGFFDDQKKEQKFELSSLDDLYNYSAQLTAAALVHVKI